MVYTIGFNLGANYGDWTIINIHMSEKSNLEEVKQIANEILGGNFKISYTDEFSDTISIKTKEASDEQISNLKNRIKEKYGAPEGTENIQIIKTPNLRIFDLVKEYIKPVAITLIAVLVYYVLAFRRLGIVKSLIMPLIEIVVIGGVYVSILAICRVPINEYVIPLGIGIYVLSLLVITICLKSKVNKLREEEQK